MKIPKKDRKERRVYYFNCSLCHARRQSFSKRVVRLGKCRICRSTGIPDGQMTMFEDTPQTSWVGLDAAVSPEYMDQHTIIKRINGKPIFRQFKD